MWSLAAQRGPTLDETRRRARRLAVRLLEAGERAPVVELELIRYRVHPAVAHEATVWATTALDHVPSREARAKPVPATAEHTRRATDDPPSPDRRRLVEVPPLSGS